MQLIKQLGLYPAYQLAATRLGPAVSEWRCNLIHDRSMHDLSVNGACRKASKGEEHEHCQCHFIVADFITCLDLPLLNTSKETINTIRTHR